ncbi:ATPase family AAA domain-containing protein 2B [Liparis tanakae]|uniref:ATPase family AAA domain-containing protein 2B n=1 Tax=Liparis tanakae TaxID=230148 RepID=A0A4Z2F3V0_9TELE|nr:ATPase family AAA domain-containing protein 2B [Liparis tanakae]
MNSQKSVSIYGSSVKLSLDVASIVLGPGDFSKAIGAIVPASQRALAPPGRALSPALRPLLAGAFSFVLKALLRVFPHGQCADGGDDAHELDHFSNSGFGPFGYRF